MSTNFHSPVSVGDSNAPATINTPLSALDAAITAVNLANTASVFTAINNVAGEGTGDAIIAVDSTTGFLAGATVVWSVSAVVYSDTIATVDSAVQLTLSNNPPVTIPNNTVISQMPSGFAGAVLRNEFNVKDPAYGATGDGTTDDTTAIQAAFTAATDGSTVLFPAGTYVVTSGITCSGVDNLTVDLRGAIIHADFAGSGTVFRFGTTNGSGTTETGLTIIGGDFELETPASTLSVQYITVRGTSDIVIRDCTMKNGSNGAITLQAVCKNFLIDNIRIIGESGYASAKRGIWLNGATASDYEALLVDWGRMRRNHKQVPVYANEWGTVSNCVLTGIEYGIYLMNCRDVKVVNNHIDLNGSTAKRCVALNTYSPRAIVSGNTFISDASSTGVLIAQYSHDVIVSNNVFLGTFGGNRDIFVQSLSEALITGNTHRTDTTNQIQIDTGGSAIIRDNVFDVATITREHGTHTAADDASSPDVLTDANANFVVNELAGKTILNITDGSKDVIASNTATTITTTTGLSGGSDNSFDQNDVYRISGYKTGLRAIRITTTDESNDAARQQSGTHNAGTSTTLTSSGTPAWDTSEWVGYFIANVTQSTESMIDANTASTLTTEDNISWDNGDSYLIYDQGDLATTLPGSVIQGNVFREKAIGVSVVARATNNGTYNGLDPIVVRDNVFYDYDLVTGGGDYPLNITAPGSTYKIAYSFFNNIMYPRANAERNLPLIASGTGYTELRTDFQAAVLTIAVASGAVTVTKNYGADFSCSTSRSSNDLIFSPRKEGGGGGQAHVVAVWDAEGTTAMYSYELWESGTNQQCKLYNSAGAQIALSASDATIRVLVVGYGT